MNQLISSTREDAPADQCGQFVQPVIVPKHNEHLNKKPRCEKSENVCIECARFVVRAQVFSPHDTKKKKHVWEHRKIITCIAHAVVVPCGHVGALRTPFAHRCGCASSVSTVTKIDRENTRGKLSSLTPRPDCTRDRVRHWNFLRPVCMDLCLRLCVSDLDTMGSRSSRT